MNDFIIYILYKYNHEEFTKWNIDDVDAPFTTTRGGKFLPETSNKFGVRSDAIFWENAAQKFTQMDWFGETVIYRLIFYRNSHAWCFRFFELNSTFAKYLRNENDGDLKSLRQQLQGNIQDQANQYAYRLQDLYLQIEQISNKSCNCSPISTGGTIKFSIKILNYYVGNHQESSKSDMNILTTVQAAIKEAIETYDADKIGLPDFALEPAGIFEIFFKIYSCFETLNTSNVGGSILDIGCTETYQAETRQLSWSWIPLWFVDYSPRTIIQVYIMFQILFKYIRNFLFITW